MTTFLLDSDTVTFFHTFFKKLARESQNFNDFFFVNYIELS